VAELRALIVVLGDQLDLDAAAFDGFDSGLDAVWMAEVADESTHVWSSKPRTVMFLAAMRHFALALQAADRSLFYTRLDAPGNGGSLGTQLQADIERLRPARLVMNAPGDWRVLQSIKAVAEATTLPLDVREDRHFFSSIGEFAEHAKGRKSLRMEYFYREQRKRHGVLMEGDQPIGGKWNFDADNRESFAATGPGAVPPRSAFAADAVTREVIALVNTRFAKHPGRLDSFAWPVTRDQALQSLQAFIKERLPLFGRYQDAMWPGDPWLFHAHLSAALNLKLLNPREVVAAAEAAYLEGSVPLASAEGFIRQILGWREYVRGVYWAQMPGYAESNALGHTRPLPDWFWTGNTRMACVRSAVKLSLANAHAHHIQRLMVIGNFALLAGLDPQALHRWYLGIYIDAFEWVELPNTLGMSQFADGGLLATKPYVSAAAYLHRMGDHCGQCPYRRDQPTGPRACPFNALYWNFLDRHADTLGRNPRLAMPYRQLARMPDSRRQALAQQAGQLLANLEAL